MIDINENEFKRLEKDLLYHPDWIPPSLFIYMSNLEKRHNFLRGQGSFERIEKINIEYRNNFKLSDDRAAFERDTLVDWCLLNPKFMGLIEGV